MAEVERAIERTTSFLQMGHVRRRVVSHGVLQIISSVHRKVDQQVLTCSLRGTHDHRVSS